MNPPCQRCGKLVYPMEKLKCLDLYWHKPCFKCEVCGMTLNLKTYKGYDKKPYCQAHYPQTKFTTVAETPEMQRLKQLTEQQSQAMYHKQFEEEKGRFTAVADDPELQRLKKNTQMSSAVKYHAEFERQKGTKLSVDTDPEIERTKRNMATISNAEYHNLKQQRNDQEKRRPSDAEQYSQMPYLLQDTTYDKPRHYSIDAGQPSYVGSLPRQKGGEYTATSSYAGGSQTLPKKVGQYANEERRGSNNSDDHFKHVHSTSGSTSKPIGSIFDKDDPLQEDEFYIEQMRDKQRRASYQRKEKQLHGFGYVAQPAPVKQASVDSAGSRNSYQDEPAPQTHKIGSVADLDPHPRNDYRHSSGNQYGGQPQYQQTQHAPQPHHAPVQQQMSGRGDDDVFASDTRRLSGPASAGLNISVSTPTDTTSPKISSPVDSALPPMPLGPRYQALYDYSAGDDDEVTFLEGDIIVDTEIIDPGWMMGRVERTGKSGMLPSNYVEELR